MEKHWGLCQLESTVLRILCYDYNGTVFIETGICKSKLIHIKKIIKKYDGFYVWDNKCRYENEDLKGWHILFVEQVLTPDYDGPNLHYLGYITSNIHYLSNMLKGMVGNFHDIAKIKFLTYGIFNLMFLFLDS